MEQQQQQKCGEALIVCREEDASHRAWRRMRPANPSLLVVQEPNGREAVLHRVVVLQVKGTEECFSIFREPNVSTSLLVLTFADSIAVRRRNAVAHVYPGSDRQTADASTCPLGQSQHREPCETDLHEPMILRIPGVSLPLDVVGTSISNRVKPCRLV